MTNVATLTIEMAANVARLQQDMSRAASTVDGAMGKIRKSADMAMRAVGAIGVGLSAAGLSSWIRQGIDAADATSKLAQKTGLLTKEVAGLQLAFDQGGAGDKMQEALGKMAKEVANNNVAFKAMGLQVTDASGKIKSTRDLIGEVAGKFASYSDGVEKTALAQQIFGKSGADLIPVLNAGAGALDEYDKKAAALGLTLEDSTTKAAEAFNDQLDLMSQRTQGVARQLATELLPVLTAVSAEIAKSAQEGGNFSTIGTVLSAVIETLVVVGSDLSFILKTLARDGEAIYNVYANILTLDFKKLRSDVAAYKTETLAARASLDEFQKSVLNARKDAQSAKDNSSYDAHFLRQGAALAVAAAKTKSAKASGANTEALKAEAEAMRALLAAAKSSNDAFDDAFDRIEATREAIEGRIRSGREMLEGIQRETAMLGLSNLEREKAIALFELERAGVVQGTEAYAAYADQISQALDAKAGKQAAIDLASDQAKAYEDAIKKQQDESDKFWGSVDSTAHEVFKSVENEGEGAFKRIGKTLKAAVLDMLYQMTIKKWVIQISGSLSGGSGGIDASGMAQSAYSRWSGAGSSAAGGAVGGSLAASRIASTYGTNVGSQQTAMLLAQEQGVPLAAAPVANSSLTAGGYTGYGYMGYAALIAAAVMVAEKLYDKGYNRAALGVGDKTQNTYGTGNVTSAGQNEGQTGIYTYSMEAANRRIGEAIGLNDKWADILSGTVRMAALFGRKLSEYGFQANIANGETSVSGYEKYKGGLFRSNKTIQTEVNPADVTAVNSLIQSWTEGTKNMARALGYSEEAINSYSGQLRINFKGAKTGEEIAKRYADAQEKLQREMLSAASGTKLTKEAFASMMDGINSSIQNAGISAQGIGDILAQGAIGRLTQAQVGEQLSEVIIGGIYNTIAQNAYAPVAQIFVDSIITPIFTAIAAGVPISQAISQASINNMVASANAAAQALNAIFADASFQQAIGSLQSAIGTISNVSVSSARHVRAYGSAVSSAASEAAQAAQAAAQEYYGLETQLLTLQGETAELRRREREQLAPGNRALFDRVKALEDEKAILDERSGLERQILELRGDTLAIQTLEREALNAANRGLYDEVLRIGKINDLKEAWGDLVGSIRDEIEQLKEDILGTSPAGGAYAQAQFAIATAQARAAATSGDSEAARAAADRLPALARSVVDTAEASASSLVEFRIAQGATLDSLNNTQRLLAESFGVSLPGFAVGTNYVPRDMIAQIHEGEAIVPKVYNPAAGGQGGQAELIAEVRLLRGQVERLQSAAAATESNTRKAANVLTEVSGGSGTFLTKATA